MMCSYKIPLLLYRCPFDPEFGTDLCIFHLPLEQKEPENFWQHLATYLLALYEINKTPETEKFLDWKSWIKKEKDDELFDDYLKKITANPAFQSRFNFIGFIFPDMDEKHNFSDFLFPVTTTFFRAQFQNANFSSAIFDGPAYFNRAVIEGIINFTRARLRNRLLFEGTEIRADARIFFWSLDFIHGVSDLTLENNHTKGEIVEPAGQIVFRDISQNINLISFLHTEIFADRLFVRFQNVNWKTEKTEDFIYDARFVFRTRNEEEWRTLVPEGDLTTLYDIFHLKPQQQEAQEKNRGTKPTENNDTRFHQLTTLVTADVERIAREIRRSTEQFGSYSDAGDYYIAEMDFRRKRTPWRKSFLFRLAMELYNWVSKYGERPSRALYWLIGIWLLFAEVYMFSGFRADIHKEDNIAPTLSLSIQSLIDFGKSLLFSFTHLIPLRFISPDHSGCGFPTSALAAIEAVLGISVVSLFLLAIRRRFHR
jgi:hypothetical protein